MSVVNVNSVDNLRIDKETFRAVGCQTGRIVLVNEESGMEKFDMSEFTEEFDLERFQKGEVAINTDSGSFVRIEKGERKKSDWHWVTFFDGEGNEDVTREWTERSMQKCFRMRPSPKFEDGWIEWKGGECPIPWAGEGEYEVKLRDGFVSGEGTAKGWGWNDGYGDSSIVSYRLTDGWVPVIDGQCPDLPGTGPWEWKYRDGEIFPSELDGPQDLTKSFFTHREIPSDADIVAVRRIPSADVSTEVQKVHALPERGQENEKSEHAAATIQKELEGIAEDIREIYRPLSQNEVMRIAGDAINGTRIGEIVIVGRDVLATLRKNWN